MVWLVLEWARRWGRLPKLELGGLGSQAGEDGDDESGKLRDPVTREVVNREREWVAKLGEFEEELKRTIGFVRSALELRPVGSTGQSASDQAASAMLAPARSLRRRAEEVLESDRDKVEKREATVREDTRRRIQWGVAAVGAASLLIACVALFGAMAAIPDRKTLVNPAETAASAALSAIVGVVIIALLLAYVTHRSGNPNKIRFYTAGFVALGGGTVLIVVTFFEKDWWTFAGALLLIVVAAGFFLWPFETRLMPKDHVDAGHG